MSVHSAPQSSSRSTHTITILAVLVLLALLVTGWLAVRQWNANPSLSIPTPRMPSPNAFDDYNAAAKALTNPAKIEADYKTLYAAPSVSPAGTESLVKANTKTLKTLRRGFAHSYLNPPWRSFNDTAPYYKSFRTLARLLALEGQDHAAHGDWGGAVNSDLDAVRMGADIPQGSAITGDLVGTACQATGRFEIWPAVNHLSAPDAKHAVGRLEAIRARQAPFADVLQEEKWFGQSVMMNSFRNPKWQAIDFWHSKRMSMRNYTRYMDAAMKSARQPYALGHTEPPMPPDVMSNFLVPVITPARLRHTDNEAQNALLMTALALRAYRLEHGTYPATLNALAPAYLARVPDDPFGLSGPVRYRRNGATFVLYSVGPDGKDDGGAPIRDTTKAGRARYFVWPDSRGDIVAGQNL